MSCHPKNSAFVRHVLVIIGLLHHLRWTVGYYRWHVNRKAAYSCSRHSNETENRGLPVTRLAIYDMDRTITISGTYTPFLLHVSAHMAPWRLVFALVIPFIMLPYLLRHEAHTSELQSLLRISYAVFCLKK